MTERSRVRLVGVGACGGVRSSSWVKVEDTTLAESPSREGVLAEGVGLNPNPETKRVVEPRVEPRGGESEVMRG